MLNHFVRLDVAALEEANAELTKRAKEMHKQIERMKVSSRLACAVSAIADHRLTMG